MTEDIKTELTPLIEQYLNIKNEYKDALLLFRLGDFYELFYDDAKRASEVLGLTLTSRFKGEKAVPMCGIPYFVAQTYISRLLKNGYKVAICEQVGEIKPGKLVERKVVRVITPGTALESVKEFTSEDNFICSIYNKDDIYGLAILDVSCGNLYLYEGKEENIVHITSLYPISEILLPESQQEKPFYKGIFLTKKPLYWYEKESALDILKDYFQVKTLDWLQTDNSSLAIYATAFLIKYLKEQFKENLPQIFKIERINLEAKVFVPKQTLEALDIFNNNQEEETLFWLLNKTATPMGYRLLKNWLRNPLNDVVELNERLNAIEELTKNKELLKSIQLLLKNIPDIERLAVKISTKLVSPQELFLLIQVLERIEKITKVLENAQAGYFLKVKSQLKTDTTLHSLLSSSIDINQDFDWFIKKGKDATLDQLKDFYLNSNKWLNDFQESERIKTNIPSLKVGYNEVFGYYIEIPRNRAQNAPSDYIRKQTLKNVERYISAALKEFEIKFLKCKEQIHQLESEIYSSVVEQTRKYCSYLHNISSIVALLDVLASLSQVALELNWERPQLVSENLLHLENSRHPILEKKMGKQFVPNDTHLDKDNYFILLTGPNMAGKSTFIKQVALIVYLAHIGSFVPAKNAKIGLVDGIYSRLTTRDSLSTGKSTFLVEMLECSLILNNATERSLVILDEIGRGTSTYDGLALAVAIIDYLVSRIRCRTLFATHYHELIALEKQLKGIKNYHMSVYEWENELVFLFKVQEGAIDRSFGIYVAKMAGIPPVIIKNAKSLLSKIERKTQQEFSNVLANFKTSQLVLFSGNFEKVICELKKINYNTLTPVEALMKLKELKEILDEKSV